MPAILLRTFITFITVICAMRLMGKRQIGQLELSELVTITMLSDLATAPITNNDLPLLHGILPIIVLVSVEVAISFLTTKSHIAKRIFDGRPAPLIFKGVLNQKELLDSRLTMNELLSEMRGQGIYCLSDVQYAFIEPSGSISFIPKKYAQPAEVSDLGLKVGDSGTDHAIVIDGKLSPDALSASGKSDTWLRSSMQKNGIEKLSDIFYFGCNDAGDINIILKEKASKKRA